MLFADFEDDFVEINTITKTSNLIHMQRNHFQFVYSGLRRIIIFKRAYSIAKEVRANGTNQPP